MNDEAVARHIAKISGEIDQSLCVFRIASEFVFWKLPLMTKIGGELPASNGDHSDFTRLLLPPVVIDDDNLPAFPSIADGRAFFGKNKIMIHQAVADRVDFRGSHADFKQSAGSESLLVEF